MIGLIAVSLGFILLRRQHRRQQAQQRFEAFREREVLRSQLEIQDHTLLQTHLELQTHLHPRLAQTRARLETLAEQWIESPERPALTEAVEMLKQAEEEVDRLAQSLDRNRGDEWGLQKRLSLELERARHLGGFLTQFQCIGQPYALGEPNETLLFRLAQELLHNAMTHSGATQLTVHIDFDPENLILIITDNGRGFDPDAVAQQSPDSLSSGLERVRQRIQLVQGECILNSQPGWGTRAEIRFPRPGSGI
ncbi:sensor histidine kinase [Larkinella bovis]|uniref:sensor histidine kinase n=1 Tax=Larkinella bovis TaxID=683041 RepID=UPI0036D3E557